MSSLHEDSPHLWAGLSQSLLIILCDLTYLFPMCSGRSITIYHCSSLRNSWFSPEVKKGHFTSPLMCPSAFSGGWICLQDHCLFHEDGCSLSRQEALAWSQKAHVPQSCDPAMLAMPALLMPALLMPAQIKGTHRRVNLPSATNI